MIENGVNPEALAVKTPWCYDWYTSANTVVDGYQGAEEGK